MLALGYVDLVVESGLKPYDVHALIPIIEAAGGIMSTWDGGSANNGGRIIAAGDPVLYSAAIRILGEH
jgi:myo-inositol-1(or 4)-monophosphatase